MYAARWKALGAGTSCNNTSTGDVVPRTPCFIAREAFPHDNAVGSFLHAVVSNPQRFGNDLYQDTVLQPRVWPTHGLNGSNGMPKSYL